MTAYVIVEITVTDPVQYEEVKRLTPPVVAQYGGKYLARGGQTEVLHGDWQPARLVLLNSTAWNRPGCGSRRRSMRPSKACATSAPGSIWCCCRAFDFPGLTRNKNNPTETAGLFHGFFKA